ncbi:hypothetical protein [Acinetobacter bereziniae]|uniref:Uncharacterized protein n=1 Tax=Acinetobacter bereziniae NIPH 3 TaxID=1217651 RepID=N8XA17_ACIBZ|nr:hypothetical protein [Acinetobacter bereziniae]ENV21071.1 hypothetical protein F963_02836 [Acinetobacter bereziniae NIPH 3]ENV21074.1 hypothetical protein F963_02839 [Acinetobacter bereziniae NIPH 3]
MNALSPSDKILNDSFETYSEICDSVKKLIINNPLLFHPFKDEQAIDIGLTLFYLLQQDGNAGDLVGWLSGITQTINGAFAHNWKYPSNIHDIR